ncbi:uncharacterized protein LOC117587236 [Drosophila guanche]|uniref:Blast:Peptidyl-prolyl cis-trans isomerase A2 n=1 Tax=Drosophila guanche TaxID=7266 RepID=A0A3B0JJG1_DROGU|nr:uncharacterized protein LOC117587236 [Drosophila guanche]SPP73366.1 blast:Peptidyl-prolyl cis-trans isomerase A2 [Drosophila guanche]
MFLREDPRKAAARDVTTVAPYVAAAKRGPYTMTNLVFNSNNPYLGKDDEQSTEMQQQQQHSFNINRKALEHNHRHHQRLIPVAIGKSPMPQMRSPVVMNEQRELYRQHRERLTTIKGKVNTCLPPPKVKVSGNGMELPYMEMLTALYKRSNNTLRTFTRSPERLAAGRWRHVSLARDKEQRQQEKNKQFHKGGELFDPLAGRSRRNKPKALQTFSYEIPMHILHRYESLMDQCDVGNLCKLLRPQIYLDVAVRGTRIQGRLAIQLFTEACPQVVLEFMRACTQANTSAITFSRTLTPMWLEGRLAMGPSTVRDQDMRNIEHDFDVLNHGVDAGILSFPSRYVRGHPRSAVNFTISFQPLSILNGKRIAFGKVRKGLQLLERIQDATGHLATAQGVVVATDCGVL